MEISTKQERHLSLQNQFSEQDYMEMMKDTSELAVQQNFSNLATLAIMIE